MTVSFRPGQAASPSGSSADLREPPAPLPRTVRTVIAACLLALAAVFGIRSMMTYDVIVDETTHLESWRNRYSGDMVSPYLVRKLAATKSLSPATRQKMVDTYLKYKPLRFLTYWLTDAPTHSTLAEIARAVSGSSVYAIRAVSLAVVLLTVLLLFKLGRLCWDGDLGFWLATLFVAAPMIQFYAGIGRWYALVQLATFLLVYRYVLFHRNAEASSFPVLLAALFAQTVHPAQWFSVFPFVAATLAVRWRRGASIRALAGETWWYVLGSAVLVVPLVFAVKVVPFDRGVRSGFEGLFKHLDLVSPFGAITGLGGQAWSWASIGVFLAFVGVGVWVLLQTALRGDGLSYVLIAGLIWAAIGAWVVGTTPRHVLVQLPVPLLVAAFGMRAVLGVSMPGRLCGLAAVAALFCVALAYPLDGYQRMLPGEGRFSAIAEWLRTRMRPEDEWAAWPYHYSNPIYSYARLTEPFLPISRDDFEDFVSKDDRTGSLYVLTIPNAAKASPQLSTLEPVARFPRHSGDLLIYEIAASGTAGVTGETADASREEP